MAEREVLTGIRAVAEPLHLPLIVTFPARQIPLSVHFIRGKVAFSSLTGTRARPICRLLSTSSG